MISAFNLIWILPVAYTMGFITCSWLAASHDKKE